VCESITFIRRTGLLSHKNAQKSQCFLVDKSGMTSLEKAVELLPERAEWMADEKDFKPLANLPAFKKLLPPPEKP